MICIICGKKASIEAFCEKCFSERNELFDLKTLRLYYCESCNEYFYKGKEMDPQNAIEAAIKKIGYIDKKSMTYRRVGNKLEVTVMCSGHVRNIKKMETKKTEFLISKRKCEACSRISGGYYEAVIQIRNEHAKKFMEKIKSNGFIEKVREGYNIKFMHKKDAEKEARNLKKKFNVKKTFKLVSEKKGKKLYRNYYSVK
jgi:nonsense-mediated mRNA decay protein 3